MRLDMTGQAGLVTGAAGGIGAAIARALVHSGAEVVLADREGGVREVARELRAESLVADLVDKGMCEEAVEWTFGAFGKINFLVNAAGVQDRGPMVELEDSGWELLSSVNLGVAFRACRAGAKQMIGTGGAMVNVTSVSGSAGVPGIVGYGATKGGLNQLTRGLAVELAPYGIRVNAVAPGYVRTSMTADLLADDARQQEVVTRIPLGRIAEPEEVAPAAVFLLSSASRYVTGEILHVDGGYVAR